MTTNNINSNFNQIAVADADDRVTGIATGTLALTGTSNLNAVSNVTITGGTPGQVLTTDGAGVLSWSTAGGNPGGLTTEVQFNNAGVFGGISSATWNGTKLSLGTNAQVGITGGTSGQVLSTDGAGTLSWTTINNLPLANGTSNIDIPAINGNVNTSVGGVANVLVVTTTGANVEGTMTATGNVTGSNLLTTGSANAGTLNITGVSDLNAVGNVRISGGTTGQVLTTDGAGVLSWTTAGGSPGGSNTQIQYNNAGAFGGSVDMTYNNITGATTIGNLIMNDYQESVASSVNTGAAILPDVNSATIFRYTADQNFTFNGFTNAVAGKNAVVIITQDGTGSRSMTSTMKFLGGDKTLSTAAGSIDVICVFYDGTNYFACLGRGYA